MAAHTGFALFNKRPWRPANHRELTVYPKQGASMPRYWYRTCSVCGQGRLFVVKVDGEASLFLLCEECESAWRKLEEIDDTQKNVAIPDMSIKFATSDDVQRAGWNLRQMHEVIP